MSHEIDTSNARDNVAFVNEAPWHGLGQRLTPNATIDDWAREAGLEYEVKHAPVTYATDDATECDKGPRVFDGRRVLYRSDTSGALGIVSNGYSIVQPRTVIEFFRELVADNGFEMEVAGVLSEGRRVWALARVHDGAPVIGQDVVRPYLLLATSYDGSMATTAKFTAVRVVCNNTLTMSAGGADGGQTERDTTAGAVVSCVRVPHSTDFDPSEARMKLGIVLDAYSRFMVHARLLADTKVDNAFALEFLRSLLPKRNGELAKIETSRTLRRLLGIWNGEIPSATTDEAKGTAWGLLNAVTWDVDHLRGSDASRLQSAWFGAGEGLKSAAMSKLVEVIA